MREQAVDKGTERWGHSAGKWHLRASTLTSFCTWSQSPLGRQANRDGELGARNRLTSDKRPHVCFLGVRGWFFKWAVQGWRCSSSRCFAGCGECGQVLQTVRPGLAVRWGVGRGPVAWASNDAALLSPPEHQPVYLWGVSAKMLRPGGLWYSPWPTSLLPSWCCCMDESWYLLMLDLPGPVLTAPHGALTAMPWRRDLYYSQSVDQETRALVSKNGILAWLMKLCHLFTVWICLQCRRPGFNPWVGKIPWKREWQPAPVFLFLFF